MLVTAEQMGERLSLSPGTVKRCAQAGIIPLLRLSGRVIRFDPDEVEEALRERVRKVTDGGKEKKASEPGL